MGGDPPIVITGGSITVDVPEGVIPPDPSKRGRFSNNNKKINHIEITGAGIQNYDQTATGKEIVIKVFYGNDTP